MHNSFRHPSHSIFAVLVIALAFTGTFAQARKGVIRAGEVPSNITPNAVATAGQLIISSFRVRGPNGANDEYIEIYNNSGADHTVADSGAGTGYAVAASDG